MSFKTKKSLDVYGKASCLLLAVSACAVITQGESANASLKNGAKTTTSPVVKMNPTYGIDVGGTGTGTKLQQSVLGDGSSSLSNQNLASTRLTGVNTTSISALGQGVGIDPSSGLPMGKVSHKYGTDADNFQVIDMKGPLNPTKRYVQFVNTKGQLKTYEEGFSTKAKLLWNYSEIGIDKFVGSDGKVHKYIYRSKPKWVSGAEIEKAQSQKQLEQDSVYGEIYTGQNTGAIGSLGTPEEGIYSTKILYNVDGIDGRKSVRFGDDIEQNKTYISTLNIDRNKEQIIGQSKSSGDGLKTHTSTLKINLGGKGTSQTGVNGDETKVHTGVLNVDPNKKGTAGSQSGEKGQGSKIYTTTLNVNLNGKDKGTDSAGGEKGTQIYTSVLNIDPNKKGTAGSKDGEEITKFYAGFFGIDQSKKGTLGDQSGEGGEVPKTYTSTLTVKLSGKDTGTSQTAGKRKVNKISIINTQSKTGDKDKGSSQTGGKGDDPTKPYTGDLNNDPNKKGAAGDQTGQLGSQSQGEGDDPKVHTSTLTINLGGKDKGGSQTGGKGDDPTKPYTGDLNNDPNKKGAASEQVGQAGSQSQGEGDDPKIYTSTLTINFGRKDEGNEQTGGKREVSKIDISDPQSKTGDKDKGSSQTGGRGDDLTKPYTGDLDNDPNKKEAVGEQTGQAGSPSQGEGDDPKVHTSTLNVNLGGKDEGNEQTGGKREVSKIDISDPQSKTGDKDKGSSQTGGRGDNLTKPYTGDLDNDPNKKEAAGEQTGQAGSPSQGEGDDPKVHTSTLNVNLGGKDEGNEQTGEKRKVNKIDISTSQNKTEDTKPYTGDLDSDHNKKGSAGDQDGQAGSQDGDNRPESSFLSELKHKLSQGGDYKPTERKLKVEKLVINDKDLSKAKEELKPVPSKGTSGGTNEKIDQTKYVVRGKDTGWTTGARRGLIDIKKEVTIDRGTVVNTMNTPGKVKVLSTYFEEEAKQSAKTVVSNLEGKLHFDVGIDGNKVKIEKTNVTINDKEGPVKGLEIDPVFAKNLSRGLAEGYGAKVEEAKKNNPLTIDTKQTLQSQPQPKLVDNTGEKVKTLTSKVSEIKNSGDLEKTQKALDLLRQLRDKMNVQ